MLGKNLDLGTCGGALEFGKGACKRGFGAGQCEEAGPVGCWMLQRKGWGGGRGSDDVIGLVSTRDRAGKGRGRTVYVGEGKEKLGFYLIGGLQVVGVLVGKTRGKYEVEFSVGFCREN